MPASSGSGSAAGVLLALATVRYLHTQTIACLALKIDRYISIEIYHDTAIEKNQQRYLHRQDPKNRNASGMVLEAPVPRLTSKKSGEDSSMAKTQSTSDGQRTVAKATPRTNNRNTSKNAAASTRDQKTMNETPENLVQYGADHVDGVSAFAWTGSQLNSDIALLADCESTTDSGASIEAGSDLYSDALASPMFQEMVRQFHREGGLKSPALQSKPDAGDFEMKIPDALVMFGLRGYCAGRYSPARLLPVSRAVEPTVNAKPVKPTTTGYEELAWKLFDAIQMMCEDYDREMAEGDDPAKFAEYMAYREEVKPLLEKIKADPSLIALLPIVVNASKIIS